MKILNFSVNALYTKPMILSVVLKFLTYFTFVLMYTKISLMVHKHRFNFLSINLVKHHNTP